MVRFGANELSFAPGAAARDIYVGVNSSIVDAPDQSSPPVIYAWAAGDAAVPGAGSDPDDAEDVPKSGRLRCDPARYLRHPRRGGVPRTS